jgi:hypothetical protein
VAIFQPAFVLARVGQDFTVTVSVTGDVSAYALEAIFKDQVGTSGTTFATKTTGGGGIVATYSAPTTSIVITLDDTDTDGLTPGAYVWRLRRTDAGGEFDLVDWSTVLLTPDAASEAPQLTNLSEFIASTNGTYTETVSDTSAKFYLQLIAAAEATVRRMCGRQFSYGTYTEFVDAPTRGNLFVRETPIHSLTSIRFDASGGYGQLTDSFGSETLLTAGTDYFFRKDRPDGLGYEGEVFTTRPGGWSWWGAQGRQAQAAGQLSTNRVSIAGAFKLVYVAGYKLIPGDLKSAIHNLVKQHAHRSSHGEPIQSESGMNYSYALAAMADDATRLDSVQQVISGYRRGDTYVG